MFKNAANCFVHYRRVLQLEKLEYARLLEKFEEMKNFYQVHNCAKFVFFGPFLKNISNFSYLHDISNFCRFWHLRTQQTELTAEKQAFKDFKEELYKERERERDEWEKERDRYRARNTEREREVDRLITRHQAEMSGLERDVERYKQETLREAAETDRVNKELAKYQEMSHSEREKLHQQIAFTKAEGVGRAIV